MVKLSASAWVAYLIVLVAGPLASAAQPAAEPTQVPGVVIDHLPAKAGQFVGSPSLAILPDGSYVASHDIFGPKSTVDHTVLFVSQDRGQSWTRLAELQGQLWSTLFMHNDQLYLMGTSGKYAQCVIRRSSDGGRTWTTPAGADSGLLLGDGHYHCAPVPVIVHNGRLWRAMEQAVGTIGWQGHHAFMMSAPVGADLLQAASWTCSNRIGRDPHWLGGKFGGWLEGNAVLTPQGNVVDILRVDYPQGGKAAVIHISADGRRATFDAGTDFIDFPGGASKFTIRFDPQSDRYWSLANLVTSRPKQTPAHEIRNTLALVSSRDLKSWDVNATVLHHPDIKLHAFQYVDWLFDGNDLVAVSRTAYDDGQGGAHSYHDANYLTFHRIADFRTAR